MASYSPNSDVSLLGTETESQRDESKNTKILQKEKAETENETLKVIEEFQQAHVEFKDSFSQENLQLLEMLFQMANSAQNGRLKASELKTFLDHHDYSISNQEANQVIKEGDIDGDFALSFQEFLLLCKRAERNFSQDLLQVFSNSDQDPLDSSTIRILFRDIFNALGIPYLPSIRQSVEYFEKKIADIAKSAASSPRVKPSTKETKKDNKSNDKVLHQLHPVDAIPPEASALHFSDHNIISNSEDGKHSKVVIQPEVDYGGDAIPVLGQTLSTSTFERVDLPTIPTSNLLHSESSHSDINANKSVEEFELEFKINEIVQEEMYKEVLRRREENTSIYDYDLIVIGSGAGGTAAAKEASKLGKQVAICDFIMPSSFVKSWGWRLGGSCVSTGCVPKMLMHYSGLIGECVNKNTSLPFGWFAPEDGKEFSNDWTILIDCIQSHIKSLNEKRQLSVNYPDGIHYYNAHCKFENPHKILLTHEDKKSEFIHGDKILIAVGSLYRHLDDVPGAPGNCITIDDIFSLRSHPGKVLIIGGGSDAIECAGLLLSLNIEVTLMSRSSALKDFDKRMSTLIQEMLHVRGLELMIGFSPIEIIKKDLSRRNSESDSSDQRKSSRRNPEKTLIVTVRNCQTGEKSSLEFNTIVLALGKKPCTHLLKLDKADVLVDSESGRIWVDSGEMTTTEDIYAIGDCASNRPSDTAVSYQAGTILSKRLFEGNSSQMEYDQEAMPKFLLTPVEYACIGLSEEAAITEYGKPNVHIYYSRFTPLQFQFYNNRYKDRYYAKLITLKSENERVIGLHYLGPNAGEIIQGFILAFKFKATKSDFDSMTSIHPTCAEIFSKMTKTSDINNGDGVGSSY